MDRIDASSGPPRAGHRRIDDIEVLRAFAVGMVLVHHLPWNLIPWLSAFDGLYRVFNFWSGVDLFLAISGFVIARSLLPLLAETDSRTAFFNTVLSFWVRRAWRLQPTALLWCGVMLVCAAVFNRSGIFETFQANFEGAVAAVLNLANLRVAYILGRAPSGVTSIYWTLSLEEQFYVALPFVVFFARKRLPLVLAVIVGAQLFVHRFGPGGDLILSITKSDALGLGVLLAIWSDKASYRRLEPKRLQRPSARIFLPLVLIGVFAFASGPVLVPAHIKVGVVALVAAAIVWLASYDSDYIFPPGPWKRLLCWMGERSYALYLIHLPAFFAAREFWFRVDPEVLTPSAAHAAILFATGFPLTFGLADLNYRFVEQPLRRRGARIAENLRRRDLAPDAGLPAASYA